VFGAQTIYLANPWPDEIQMHAVLVSTEVHGLARELGPVVDGDRLWSASQRDDLIQRRGLPFAAEGAVGESVRHSRVNWSITVST